MSKRLLVPLLAFLLSLPLAARAEGDAREVVETLYAHLLQAMKQASQLGFQGRVELLKPAVSETYDMVATTKATMGVAYNKLSADEVNQLADAFSRLSVESYAEQFDGWDGERFEVGEPRPSTDGSMIVPSRLVPRTGQPTEIDYLLHQEGGHWRIIDVLLDGTISQTAVRRSEFISIYRHDGFPGLIDSLNRKIAALGQK
jgi:phospholipid transport system substrate-binding protein